MWKTDEVPEKYLNATVAWRTYHPDWKYIFWTDETMLQHMTRVHPESLSLYNNFKYSIQRSDAFRYFVLDDYGGIYADLDIYPVENIEKYLNAGTDTYFIFNRGNKGSSSLHNSLIASVPNNPLMKIFQEELTTQGAWFAWSKYSRVITTTGSHRMARALKRAPRPFTVLSFELFNSYSMQSKQYHVRDGVFPVIRAVEANSTWNSFDARFVMFVSQDPTYIIIPSIIGIAMLILLVALSVSLRNKRCKYFRVSGLLSPRKNDP